MSNPESNPSTDAGTQRDALMESEKKAHENQPENLKEEAVTDKVVEIRPDSTGKAPIQGLDPKKK